MGVGEGMTFCRTSHDRILPDGSAEVAVRGQRRRGGIVKKERLAVHEPNFRFGIQSSDLQRHLFGQPQIVGIEECHILAARRANACVSRGGKPTVLLTDVAKLPPEGAEESLPVRSVDPSSTTMTSSPSKTERATLSMASGT